ncbi:MAG TPA: heme-binding protein, partial [Verrucomicrobiae bacterium]
FSCLALLLFHNSNVKQRAAILWFLLVTSFSALGQMTSNQVATVMAQALTRANDFLVSGDTSNGVVAVVDREGFVLGVWSLAPSPSGLDVIDAITKAGTAAFLSSDQQALTSRTAGFIVQQHFPPGIKNREPGPLVGVNFSNLSFSDVNHFKDPHTFDPLAFGGGGTNGAPITPLGLSALSGLAGSPGGVPLYDANGHLLGAVGAAITGHAPIPELYDIQQTAKQRSDIDEDVALAGQIGFAPNKKFFGSQVFIAGIRIPYVNSKTVSEAPLPLGTIGAPVPPYDITNSPPVNYPTLTLGGVPGEMRAPIIDDPVGGLIAGQARLTATEVTNILTLSAERTAITRAGIRLPRGQAAEVFITVVNNPDSPGVAPTVLGVFRTSEATMFSWDVAVQKARTALYFSSPLAAGVLPAELQNKALSTRAIGFLAESMYPPGIQKKPPGPLLGLQEKFSLLPIGVTNILNGVFFNSANAPLTAPDPNLPNGITIFPGGFPLYRNGVLIGAIGVSGDGVDQDDIISASGTVNFLAPNAIRSDQIIFRGTRLPYAKFPRNPSL